MEITELRPGFYKIRIKDYLMPYGRRRFQPPARGEISLLRVEGSGEQRRYFVDDNVEGFHPNSALDYLMTYEVVERLKGPPEVHNPNITISFNDERGAPYAWSVKGAWALRALFERMPWLQKPFGYFRNRSRLHPER